MTMTAASVPTVGFDQQVSSFNPSPGSILTYSLSLTVTGSSAGQAAVTDVLPANLTFVQFTPGDPVGSQSGQTIIWNLSSLAPGIYTLGFSASVGNGVPGGTVFITQGNVYLSQSNTSYFSNSAVTVVALTSTPTATSTSSATPVAGLPSSPVIYPNPVSGNGPVSIYLGAFTGTVDVKVEIFTTSFRKVQTSVYPHESGGQSVLLSLTDNWGRPLANGLYYVAVFTPQGRTIDKLLILH